MTTLCRRQVRDGLLPLDLCLETAKAAGIEETLPLRILVAAARDHLTVDQIATRLREPVGRITDAAGALEDAQLVLRLTADQAVHVMQRGYDLLSTIMLP